MAPHPDFPQSPHAILEQGVCWFSANMNYQNITAPILAAYPDTHALYLYGSWGTEYQRRDSDLDMAVLLPPATARALNHSTWSRLSTEVATMTQ